MLIPSDALGIQIRDGTRCSKGIINKLPPGGSPAPTISNAPPTSILRPDPAERFVTKSNRPAASSSVIKFEGNINQPSVFDAMKNMDALIWDEIMGDTLADYYG